MAENAELSYRVTTTALNNGSQTINSPIDGVIRRITVSWPSGCNFRVEVVFNHKRLQFIPTPSVGAQYGISLDNFTERLEPNCAVIKNDPIEMYCVNHDGANTHTISAVMLIEGYEIGDTSERVRQKESTCKRRT
jgi:hypothetical protein